MKSRQGPFPPARSAADCHDWLPAEDVIRHALAAFYATCQYYDRHDPADHNEHSRRQFCDDLTEIFLSKLHDQGFKRQVPGFSDWAAEVSAWWIETTPKVIAHGSGDTLRDIHRRASQNEND